MQAELGGTDADSRVLRGVVCEESVRAVDDAMYEEVDV